MEDLWTRVDRYIEQCVLPRDPVLEQALADTAAATMPAIAVSPAQGKQLELLARLVKAVKILEIGTLGGYSTICLARALPRDGRLVTLEVDARHAEVARRSLERAAITPRLDLRVGPAADSLRDLIRSAVPPFDLVFLDADKSGYVEYLGLVLELVRPGALILADNVIRHGLVIDPSPGDPNDAGAKAYNEAIASDPRLESLILPIVRARVDGLATSMVR